MSKGSGRRRPQVDGNTISSNWDAIFGKKDQPSDIECSAVTERSDAPCEKDVWVRKFKALEGMGGAICEGPMISAVCAYLPSVKPRPMGGDMSD